LLSQGYALAGTAYSQGGWAVEQGLAEVPKLAKFIRSLCGFGCWPKRTIFFGVSMGGLIALKNAETQNWWNWFLDGTISACGVAAGATRTTDLSLLFNLGYDAGFFNFTGGWNPAWGTVQAPKPGIVFNTEVLPTLTSQLSDISNFGKFEFQRLVSFLSAEDYYPGLPNHDITLFTDFFFSTQALAEIMLRAGGKVTDNVGKHYSLSAADKTYLATLGVDADTLLEYMNTQTNFAADPTARAYLNKFTDLTGKIKTPVLTMHTRNDGLVPPQSETVYKDAVAAQGCLSRLYQVYTSSSGHCNFSQQQVVTAINVMSDWLKGRCKGGTKPSPEDFPESEGWMPASYTPGAWPYSVYGD